MPREPRTCCVRWLAMAAVVAASSCRPGAEERRVVLRNEGTLCFGSADRDAGLVELKAGEPLTIRVRSACLSNACTTARSSTCSVARQGGRLIVTSELTFRGPEDIAQRCPGDCTALEAHCATEALPPGNYAVVLGSRHADLTIPSRVDAPCDVGRARQARSMSAAEAGAPPPPLKSGSST